MYLYNIIYVCYMGTIITLNKYSICMYNNVPTLWWLVHIIHTLFYLYSYYILHIYAYTYTCIFIAIFYFFFTSTFFSYYYYYYLLLFASIVFCYFFLFVLFWFEYKNRPDFFGTRCTTKTNNVKYIYSRKYDGLLSRNIALCHTKMCAVSRVFVVFC